LQETQSSLAAHIEKIRVLEETLAEHAAMKSEMNALREMIEDRKRVRSFSPSNTTGVRPMSPETHRSLRDHHDAFDESSEIDDDARSIASTVMPHELERVDEEDEEAEAEAEAERMRMRMEEQAEEEAEAHRREMAEEGEEEVEEQRRRLGRPRTPEPTGLGLDDDHDDPSDRGRSKAYGRLAGSMSPPSSKTIAKVDEHAERLDALASQLETALELSRSLQNQHAAAQSTIRELESKVGTLETLVRETQAQQTAVPAGLEEGTKEGLTDMLSEWKKSVEGQWADVREEWGTERERLRKAHDEWESRLHTVEEGVEGVSKKVADGLAEMEAKSRTLNIAHHLGANGDARGSPSSHGLVTPPSPRSLSAGSMKPRNRRRRGSARGRSSSREDRQGDSGSGSGSMGSADLSSSEQSYGQPIAGNLTGSPAKGKSRPRSPWGPDGSSTDDDDEETRVGDNDREQDAKKYPTPKSSWTGTESSVNGSATPGSPTSAHHHQPDALARSKVDIVSDLLVSR
jgi:hypothetical protein